MTVAFRTPGHISIDAFTTFGINVKPNSPNPIGYFGTGLKYAIAVLLREGCNVTLFIGDTRYGFYMEEKEFRNKEFTFIYMDISKASTSKKGKWVGTKFFKSRRVPLPFTTEFGKNWKLWQALRELESNTRDEGGMSYHVPGKPGIDIPPPPDETLIYVEDPTGRFDDEYGKLSNIFLSQDPKDLIWATPRVAVYNKPSRHIYYRGLRVMDIPDKKMSKYTYNIIEYMTLTEDRTLMYSILVPMMLGAAISECTNDAIIEAVITAGSDYYESRFSYDAPFIDASEQFKNALNNMAKFRRDHMQPALYGYWKTYLKPKDPVDPKDLHAWLTEWMADNDVTLSATTYGQFTAILDSLDELRQLKIRLANGKASESLIEMAAAAAYAPSISTQEADSDIPF